MLLCSRSPFRCFGSPTPASGSAPLIPDGHRIYAELEFVRVDGTLRKTLAFVDLGSLAMIVSEALFKELHLEERKSLTFQVGGMPVQVDSSTIAKDAWLPFPIDDGRKVEALLPAGVMQKFLVVIDYAQRSLTLAQPGTLKREGIPVAILVNEKTGLIAVEVSIDGQTYPMTIDCGSA